MRADEKYSVVDGLIFALSIIGLVASAILAVVELSTLPESHGDLFKIARLLNFLWAVIVIIIFSGYYNKLTECMPRDISANMYAGCPAWMQYSCGVAVALGVLLFFAPKIMELLGVASPSDGRELPATLSAGFGLIVNASLPAQTYSIRNLQPR